MRVVLNFRRQKSEVGGRNGEGGKRQSAQSMAHGVKTEDREQKSEDRNRKSEVGGRNGEVRRQILRLQILLLNAHTPCALPYAHNYLSQFLTFSASHFLIFLACPVPRNPAPRTPHPEPRNTHPASRNP